MKQNKKTEISSALRGKKAEDLVKNNSPEKFWKFLKSKLLCCIPLLENKFGFVLA
jgi:hypothetical protein